ncbi:MAG TPA: hypothetical protein VGK70_13525, partial [Thermoanaerobaculia bacterium]
MSVRKLFGWFGLGAALAVGSWPCASEAAEEQKVVLALRVNEQPKGEVIALLRGPDVFAGVAELQAAGVLGFGGDRETIGGQPYVSLLSLVPDIRFVLDEREVALRLTVSPAHLESTTVDLRPGPPQGMVRSRDSSAFVNYAVNSSGFE